jgi:hypothetical protein
MIHLLALLLDTFHTVVVRNHVVVASPLLSTVVVPVVTVVPVRQNKLVAAATIVPTWHTTLALEGSTTTP